MARQWRRLASSEVVVVTDLPRGLVQLLGLFLEHSLLFYRSTESNRQVKLGCIESELIYILKRAFWYEVMNIHGDLF